MDTRPKREIHAAHKDVITYSSPNLIGTPANSKAARRNNPIYKECMKACSQIWKELTKPKYKHLNAAFMQPVDPVAHGAPNYYQVIKRPMDLSNIKAKLDDSAYHDQEDFADDIRLMFSNCMTYNQPGNHVYQCAQDLEKVFLDKWQKAQDTFQALARQQAEAVQEDNHAEMEVPHDTAEGKLIFVPKKINCTNR